MSLSLRAVCTCFLLVLIAGCSQTARDLPLDTQIARKSLDTALQAWVDGKRPSDLQPEIIVGDAMWTTGKKLVSYEIKSEVMNDGTNLYLLVVRQFDNPKSKKPQKSEVTYIVGTSPVITIFPQ